MPRKRRETLPTGSPELVVMLDLGNALLKWIAIDPVTLEEVSRGAIPHDLACPHEYQFEHAREMCGGADRKRDLLVFEGAHYIIGEMAEHYAQSRPIRIGAARFERSYYTPLFLRVMAETMDALEKKEIVVAVRISYASVDTAYRGDQLNLVKGEFEFQVPDGERLSERRVTVVDAKYYNETHGGYLAAALDVDLKRKVFHQKYIGQSVIVIDVGGSTVTAITVDDEGVPNLNPASTYSVAGVGILTSVMQLIQLLRHDTALHDLLKTTTVSQNAMLEALRTGYLTKQGVRYDIRDHVARALSPVLTPVDAAIARLGGGVGFNACIVTGGGGALVSGYLNERFPAWSPRVAYPDEPHMANVFGACQAYRALQLSKEAI
jgi:hypothetical protein